MKAMWDEEYEGIDHRLLNELRLAVVGRVGQAEFEAAMVSHCVDAIRERDVSLLHQPISGTMFFANRAPIYESWDEAQVAARMKASGLEEIVKTWLQAHP